MNILPESSRTFRQAPDTWFTGVVWLDEIITAPQPATFKVFSVTFAPAARTHWHTHPIGQALHVLSGVGLIQRKGEPIQQIQSGDSVWIEPNELHWHGAGPKEIFVHLAMQQTDDQGLDVVWLDPVTDEEYTQTN